MNRALSAGDYQTIASFRYALRKFLRFSKDFLAANGRLTPEQYEALLAVKAFSNHDGLLVGQLSERLQVKHHTAVSLTEKLVARKLVAKQRGLRDRRHVYVKLTKSGSNLLARLARVHWKRLQIFSPQIISILKRVAK